MRQPDWQTADGRVRLYCGDCLEILPTLDRESIECLVTSPPYNTLSIVGDPSGSWADSHGGAGFVRAWRENGYEDDIPEHEYQQQQNRMFATCADATTATASLFYNHKLRWRDGECLNPSLWFRPEGWRYRQEIIWDRGGGMMSNARMFCGFDERILWLDKGCHKWNQPSTSNGTIWRIARMQQQQGKIHPVQFPLDIPLRCLAATTDRDDIGCDPYMGSGTTGVACVQLGRRFIGIEKEPRYFEGAVKRIKSELERAPLFEPKPTYVTRSLFGEQGEDE